MSLILLLVLALYALSAAAYAAVFWGRAPSLGRAAQPLLMVAIVLHSNVIMLGATKLGMLPMTSVGEALGMVALCLAICYFWIEVRRGTPMIGMFVMAVVALLMLPSALGLGGERHPSEILRSPLFAMHTLAAVASYCALALASIYGVLFLLLYHELKLGRFSLVYHRLPSLDELSRTMIRSTAAGFTLLGMTIVLGFVWISHVFPGYYADPKVILTVVVWLVSGSALLVHYRLHRGGTLTVYLSLAGFGLLLLSTLIPGHLAGSFHHFR